jgi:hypothetical protein
MRARAAASSSTDVAVAARFLLPVSGIRVVLREPKGADDLLLAEAKIEDPALALAIAQRLGRAEPAIDWAELTVSDLDVLILRLRQALLGNRIVADITCGAPECGSRIDLSFEIESFLMHHRPRSAPFPQRGWTVEPCSEEPGWFRLVSGGEMPSARFRLPTAADQVAVFGHPDAELALARCCIRPPELPARLRARVEAAMAVMAPRLVSDLQGTCPDCGATVAARFEARYYSLQEMRDRARFVYDDIDVLAQRYHWSERAILRMPNARRTSYAELARQGGGG